MKPDQEPKRPAQPGVSAISGTQMLWAKAARSVALQAGDPGLDATIMSVLPARVLRFCAEGLRQYLTVRLADPALAAEVLRDVKTEAARWGGDILMKPPGGRAHLYKLARSKARERLKATWPSREERLCIPWQVTGPSVPTQYLQALSKLRADLAPAQAELLELHFTRELSVEELAHVVELPETEVQRQLDELKQQAQDAVGPNPPSRLSGVAGALIEAFAVKALQHAPQDDEQQPEDKPPLPAGTILGERYELERCAGRGAFGDVYRARDTEVDGHVVALKLTHNAAVSEQARTQALRELRLIAAVFHPSVVDFKDHGWYKERLWFVMPWYQGETLESRIGHGPMQRADARRIFEPLARALAAMHASGLRHQDIKPDNIFLAQTSSFGLGRAEDDELPVLLDLGVAATEAEVFLAGTPQYFAPEVAAPFAKFGMGREITGKADVFSLALSLRNALEPSTQEDVQGGAIESFIEYRAHHTPEFPSNKSLQFLKSSFERWLSQDPDERPTAEEFAAELAILTYPEETRERRLRTLRWLMPALLAIAVVFAAVVVTMAKQTELQRYRAEQAKTETESVKADLDALEQDVGELKNKYRSSALTRQQLVSKLASNEGQRHMLEKQLARSTMKLRQTRFSLNATAKKVGALTASLEQETAKSARLSQQLEGARSQVDELSGNLRNEREKAAELNRQLSQSQAKASQFGEQNQVLQKQLAESNNTLATLQTQLKQASAAEAAAKRELAAARAEIETLRKQLRDTTRKNNNSPTSVPSVPAQPVR